MTIARSPQHRWKEAINRYLTTPVSKDLFLTPTIDNSPKSRSALLWDVVYMLGMFELNEFSEFYIFLKAAIKKRMFQKNEVNYNQRLSAIESAAVLPAKKPTQTSFLDVTIDTKTLCKIETNNDHIKLLLLFSMEPIYFAVDQDKIRSAVSDSFTRLCLKDKIFAEFVNDKEFEKYFKNILDNLLKQADVYAEAFTKHMIGGSIKRVGFYHVNKDLLAKMDDIFKSCCEKAQYYKITDYQLDRDKVIPAYQWPDLYKPSAQSNKIDNFHTIMFALKLAVLFSVVTWISTPGAVLAPLSTAGCLMLYFAYLAPYFMQAGTAAEDFTASLTDKAHNLLNIKFVKNKKTQEYEYKLESFLPAPRTEEVIPKQGIAFNKKIKTQALITPVAVVAPAETKVIQQEQPRILAGANGNIYYLLANNSFFRCNADELNARKESINSEENSLSAVVKNMLGNSNDIGSQKSTGDGFKKVGVGEKIKLKKRGLNNCEIKLKPKSPYGSLRIFMGFRQSTIEETNLLGRQATVQSPKIYGHK